jgi:hypothetical protein
MRWPYLPSSDMKPDDWECTLPVAQLAERANVGRAKVRAAIRLAESLGLIAIEETPDRKRVIINRGVMSRC